MNNGRHRSIVNGLTGAARKVYDSVPIQEPWDFNTIMADVVRSMGQQNKRIMRGCLDSLVQQGIVREWKGTFIRTGVHEKMRREQIVLVAPGQEDVVTEIEPPAVDKFMALAQRAREMGDTMIQLAKDIEDIALEVEEQVSDAEKKAETARKLRELLKDL